MIVYVKNLTGNLLYIEIEPDDDVGVIWEKLEGKDGMPPDQQRLIFNGKPLEYGRKVSDYNITKECILHLVLKLRGGGGED